MTIDNVIDTCDNLNDLELDFSRWNMLTYDQKKKSDDICISLHGVNNTQYYEKQKALLLTINEATMIIDNSESDAMNDKLLQTKIAMQNNDMVVVIPLVVIDALDLENLYNKFTQLPQQFKNLSNGESLRIWGVSVEDAYGKVKGMLAATTSEEEANNNADTFIESATINIKNILENNVDRVPFNMEPVDYTNDIPQIVPYLTYTEYCNIVKNDGIVTVNNYINIEDPKSYYDTIESMQLKLESATSEEQKKILEDGILKAGWFPYKKINGESIKEARERQTKWFNDNMQCRIIDLSEFNFDFISDDELVTEVEGIDGDVNRLQPIFISLISTKTPIGRVIRAYTHSDYSHAGIALNSKLDKIYSYAIHPDNKQKGGGFTIESLKYYTDIGSTLSILVLGLFVDKDVKKRMKDQLKFYEKNRANTRYDGGDFVNIVFNIKKNNSNNSLNMVCSQFVDHILKSAGIDVTNKSSNLVSPKMLSAIDPNVTNAYILYNGSCEDYKYKDVDKRIKYLLNTMDYSKLSATSSNNMKNQIQNNKVIESFMSVCTDNEEINQILRECRSFISPSSQIEEFDIEKLCEDNHRNLMLSSHSDLNNIARLLYENRGLQLYIESNNIEKTDGKILTVLETDFAMYKNILSNVSLTDSDLNEFGRYYKKKLEGYNMKYNGADIVMV